MSEGATQLSVAVALNSFNTALYVQIPPFVLRFIFPLTGHIIEGAWLSTTVTTCSQEEKFPEASVAVHVTGVLPIG